MPMELDVFSSVLLQQEQNDAYLPAEMGIMSKQPTNYFCKTLTASDKRSRVFGLNSET